MTRSRDNATNVAGDISGVTAGTGLSGGGTGGTVTLNLSTPVAATNGGTGLSTFTTGDMIYASGANTPAKLSIGSSGQVLTVASGIPSWATAAGGGKVLQVVSATTTTQTTIASTSFTDTNITATITPTLVTSKILVLVNFMAGVERSARRAGGGAKLLRGATTLLDYGANNIANSDIGGGSSNNLRIAGGFHYYDSPATTSATIYKVQGRAEDTSSSGLIIFQDNSSPSTITLLEIGA